MQKVLIRSLVIFLLSFQIINAQQPQKSNSVEIYNQIQKLNFLGSVLYIAAHPDDENTRLISYFSNDTKAIHKKLSEKILIIKVIAGMPIIQKETAGICKETAIKELEIAVIKAVTAIKETAIKSNF